jgi:hypothetical protein
MNILHNAISGEPLAVLGFSLSLSRFLPPPPPMLFNGDLPKVCLQTQIC